AHLNGDLREMMDVSPLAGGGARPAPEAPGDADAAPPPATAEVPWFDGTLSLLVSGQQPLASPPPPPPGAAPPPVPGAAPLPVPGAAPPPVPAAAPPPVPAAARAASGPRAILRPWLSVGRELGRGGMSRVCRGRDQNLGREAAVKVLDAAVADQPGARERFIEEARITAQLDHPNIPAVHDLWTNERGELCFTMKLVRGRTLSEILAERAPGERTDGELERLLQILLKVCDAVSFAHSRGVIHRDLKPDNVMVGSHGQVYVMDWGCALVGPAVPSADHPPVTVARDPAARSLDPPGCAIGTCSYMAPEQARARPEDIDARTDVYLLGGILYEILTGQPPHRGTNVFDSLLRGQRGEVPDPQALAGPVPLPPELCRIATRALHRDREGRYPSVDLLKADLERSLRNGWWFATATFAAGDLIVREGDEGDAACIITRGRCEAFRLEDGRRVVLRSMGPGEAFGETAIFTAKPRSASVAAVEDVTVIIVTRDALERAIGTDSWVGAFVRALAERFRDVDARLARQQRPETA
ncbi:MAG TPA: protein kinase, partial [Polyangia bacterium]